MQEQRNPWKTIWLNPKATIRYIAEEQPYKHYILLMVLGGIAHALNYASAMNLGDVVSVREALVMCVLLGPLSGFITLSLGGWVLHWISHRLNGQATIHETRLSMAWSWAPIVYLLPLWGIKYILFRNELFTADKSYLESEPFLNGLYGIFSIVDFVITIVSLYILFSALSEVNRFSVWKSLGAYLLMTFVFTIPVLLILSITSI